MASVSPSLPSPGTCVRINRSRIPSMLEEPDGAVLPPAIMLSPLPETPPTAPFASRELGNRPTKDGEALAFTTAVGRIVGSLGKATIGVVAGVLLTKRMLRAGAGPTVKAVGLSESWPTVMLSR